MAPNLKPWPNERNAPRSSGQVGEYGYPERVLGVRRIVSRGKIGIAVTGATVSVLLAAAAADAAITARNSTGTKLASFNKVACNANPGSAFTGTAIANGWKLTVRIEPFGDFGYYHIGYGSSGKVKFRIRSGETTYSNTVKPPNTSLPETGEGGNVGFPGGGDKIGISFGTAFKVGERREYASLFGLATCG